MAKKESVALVDTIEISETALAKQAAVSVAHEEKSLEKENIIEEKAPKANSIAETLEGKSAEKEIALVQSNELLQILNAQNDILDCMLTQQKKIHDNVRERKWIELESNLTNMRAYSDAFVNLDQCRENFVGEHTDLYLTPDVEPVFVSVRTKLSRSKIENSALATYVQSTQEFVEGVLQECIPQKRNTLYTRTGKIVKPVQESVVVDTVF